MTTHNNLFTKLHSGRKLTAILFSCVALLTAMDIIWVSHRRTISTAFATTRIMGPLESNGCVNYRKAIDHQALLGVNTRNNAAVGLIHALGPKSLGHGMTPFIAMKSIGMPLLPANGAYFLSFKTCYRAHHPAPKEWMKAKVAKPNGALGRHPFSAASHPVAAAWLKENSTALHWARLASQCSHFYIPLPRRSLGWYSLSLTPIAYLEKTSELQEALLQQAMLSLYEKNTMLCRRDLLAAHRLAVLIGQGPLLTERLVARNMDLRASEADWAVIQSNALNGQDLESYGKALAAIPPFKPLSGTVNNFLRWAQLDYVQWQAHNWCDLHIDRPQAGFPIRVSVFLPPNYAVRMMHINTWYDRFTKAFQYPNARDRREALKAVELHLNNPSSQQRMSRERLYLSLTAKNLGSLISLSARVQSARRITQTLLALTRYRTDHGAYPPTLAALVPNYLTHIPLDAFTGRPITYLRDNASSCSLGMAGSFHSLSSGEVRRVKIRGCLYHYPGSGRGL